MTLPYEPDDKELVWAWQDGIGINRLAGFYDAINRCMFTDEGKAHGIELITRYYSEKKYNAPLFKSGERINYLLKQKELLSDKEYYINTLKVPIAMFSSKQEKWLKWHCPLDFVREQLKNDLGLKDYWYYKLFFKY